MADNDKKEKSGCCKGFEESACPCIDQGTGEKNCGESCGDDCGPKEEEKSCCTDDKGCCPPPRP